MPTGRMRVVRGLYNCTPALQKCVVTIGNFDGLHVGHHKMLEALHQEARRLDAPRCLMTFEPLPREFFSPHQQTVPRLTNLGEKLRLLAGFEDALRPEYVLLLRFNEQLAKMTAHDFIQQVLVDTLQAQSVVVGDDFRFGAQRKGDYHLLQQVGSDRGFTVKNIASQIVHDERVSSTMIRQALHDSQFEDVRHMLGRPYTISGRVNHGEKRGRSIGFPTANIHLKRMQTPLHGVYSVTMHSEKHGDITGVANVGHRPTVDGERIQLEVHLFDFNDSLYGEHVCVSFQHKIRDEQKFESFDALKQQIVKDCEQARALHQQNAK
jgi:riboflavin kinase/FMN adenylyltransferase